MWGIIAVMLILGILGASEACRHHRLLAAIPIRIQVNGTRGKSTTTRLIAAGLRQAGFRVIAKTTGSAAQLILEDGTENSIKRGNRVSIHEQLQIVAEAAKRGAEVLVVECMALSPENQWVCEHQMIRSTIGVITNVREDHLEEMGPRLADVARALSSTIPRHGQLVTGEDEYLCELRRTAAARGTTVHVAKGTDLTNVEMAQFPALVFRDNVACALSVCRLLGVSRATALAGMVKMTQDPGSLKVYRLEVNGRRVYYVNGLAANDKTSTVLTFNQCCRSSIFQGLPVIGIMNNRSDRPNRILDLSKVVTEISFDHLFLLGGLGWLAARHMASAGLSAEKITDLTKLEIHQALNRMLAMVKEDTVFFAFGNIKGSGWEVADFFADKGVEWDDCTGGGDRYCC